MLGAEIKTYELAYQILDSFKHDFWQSEQEKISAFSTLVNFYELEFFPEMTRIIVDHFGGWGKILKKQRRGEKENPRYA